MAGSAVDSMRARIVPTEVSRYAAAFALGFAIFGPFDFLYTHAGGQTYGAGARFMVVYGWPAYVPLQMGLAAVVLMWIWRRVRRALPAAVAGPEKALGPRSLGAALVPLLAGLGFCFVLLGHELHASFFVAMTAISVLALALFATRIEILAFSFVGLLGSAAEWGLLDPGLDYWRFTHGDLFHRLPAWEPYVYGWIGVALERLSSDRSAAL